jgi:uncharacterized membrane protein YphA (DoxX/SURF4 family)
MRPDPLHDTLAFLSKHSGLTYIFDALLALSLIFALLALARDPAQREARNIGVWLARLFVGAMWWQQSLWKVPFDFAGLLYWMKQEVEGAAIPLEAQLVANVAIPHISIFGWIVYLMEALIGVSLILGLFTRLFAFIGLLEAMQLWLGLYNAKGEWPWTYFFLIVIQFLFVLDPPGRALGLDALRRRRPGWLS